MCPLTFHCHILIWLQPSIKWTVWTLRDIKWPFTHSQSKHCYTALIIKPTYLTYLIFRGPYLTFDTVTIFILLLTNLHHFMVMKIYFYLFLLLKLFMTSLPLIHLFMCMSISWLQLIENNKTRLSEMHQAWMLLTALHQQWIITFTKLEVTI